MSSVYDEKGHFREILNRFKYYSPFTFHPSVFLTLGGSKEYGLLNGNATSQRIGILLALIFLGRLYLNLSLQRSCLNAQASERLLTHRTSHRGRDHSDHRSHRHPELAPVPYGRERVF